MIYHLPFSKLEHLPTGYVSTIVDGLRGVQMIFRIWRYLGNDYRVPEKPYRSKWV